MTAASRDPVARSDNYKWLTVAIAVLGMIGTFAWNAWGDRLALERYLASNYVTQTQLEKLQALDARDRDLIRADILVRFNELRAALTRIEDKLDGKEDRPGSRSGGRVRADVMIDDDGPPLKPGRKKP